VSNDNGITGRRTPLVPRSRRSSVTGTDRQWLAVDNGSKHNPGMSGAAEQHSFLRFPRRLNGTLDPQLTRVDGHGRPRGWLVFTNSNVITTDPAYTGGGNCGELVFDPVNRKPLLSVPGREPRRSHSRPCEPLQRTGITFTTHVLTNSPGGSVSNFSAPLWDSAGNV